VAEFAVHTEPAKVETEVAARAPVNRRPVAATSAARTTARKGRVGATSRKGMAISYEVPRSPPIARMAQLPR
jgi:hypothetical protein